MARDDQSVTMNTKRSLGQDDTKIFTKVHLLAGKLVPVVAIHSLGGSHANRHHTPNPQSGATQPTQDEDHCRRNMVGSPPRGVPVVVDYQ